MVRMVRTVGVSVCRIIFSNREHAPAPLSLPIWNCIIHKYSAAVPLFIASSLGVEPGFSLVPSPPGVASPKSWPVGPPPHPSLDRVQVLSGRVVGAAEEGIRCLLFADLIEIPQQALDAPPPVPPDYGTGNLVAEDEPQEGRVVGVKSGCLRHRSPGLGDHLLPAFLIGGVELSGIVPPHPHKDLQPRLIGKVKDRWLWNR